jgi:hypothetical protein
MSTAQEMHSVQAYIAQIAAFVIKIINIWSMY